MNASNRVIVNTAAQYTRSVISIIITLYTSRLVLEYLGVNDYGIYSLVAGVIAMLAFIQANLSNTNVRFLSYYHGRKDMAKIREIFNNSMTTQLIIAGSLCLILLAITDPVFNHLLNIAPERVGEAKVVYWVMLVSLFFNFINIPYVSVLTSHENIVYSSVIQIIDAVFRIPIALSLKWIPEYKLPWYAAMMAGLILFNFFCYSIYCRKKYSEARGYNIRSFNPALFREMFGFMGWNVYGTLCVVARTQGIAVLLNRFYTTAINAAYGIAFQVSGQISFLSAALGRAITPQIMKAEGGGDRLKMFRLSEISCKMSFLMMSTVSIPAIIYMPTILSIWLKSVPEYTSMFCRFVLLAAQVDLLSCNLSSANQAIGNVKVYNLTQQTLKVVTLPLAWLALKLGYSCFWVMVIYVAMEALCVISRVIFMKMTVNLSIKNYVSNVLICSLPPVVINTALCWVMSLYLHGWLLLVTFACSGIVTLLTTYFLGLKSDEHKIIDSKLEKVKTILARTSSGER